MNRWAQRRDANEHRLVTMAEKMGARLWFIGKPVDWLCLWRGIWVPVEIKDGGKHLTDGQIAFVTEVDQRGSKVWVWRSETDVENCLT